MEDDEGAVSVVDDWLKEVRIEDPAYLRLGPCVKDYLRSLMEKRPDCAEHFLALILRQKTDEVQLHRL